MGTWVLINEFGIRWYRGVEYVPKSVRHGTPTVHSSEVTQRDSYSAFCLVLTAVASTSWDFGLSPT